MSQSIKKRSIFKEENQFESPEEVGRHYEMLMKVYPDKKDELSYEKERALRQFPEYREIYEKSLSEKRREESPSFLHILPTIKKLGKVSAEELCLIFPIATIHPIKNGNTRTIQGDGFELHLTGHPDFGHLLVRDLDILHVLCSLMESEYQMRVQQVGKKNAFYPGKLFVCPHQILKSINKSNAGSNYKWLKQALGRLSHCSFRIETGERSEAFSFLNPVSWDKDYDGSMKRLRLSFNQTFLDMFDYDRTRFWNISSDYLLETNALKKRLMGIIKVKKHPSTPFSIFESELLNLLGTKSSPRDVRHKVKKYSNTKGFPWKVTCLKNESTGRWRYVFI